MDNYYSLSLLNRFFHEIYKVLRESNKEISEVWYKISEFGFFNRFNQFELNDFLSKFNFIKKERWGHMAINKIGFILESLQFLSIDIKKLSELLDFRDFESLIELFLNKSNYKTIKNFRFTDKSTFKHKTSQNKYEIDVIGLNRKHILVIDAKQWNRRDSFTAINKAANLQFRRVIALKKNLEVFSNLIQKLLGINSINRCKLPFTLIPIIVSMEESRYRLNDLCIPLVPIYKFNGFLQELENFLQYYKTIEIKKLFIQKQLI